MNDHATSAAPVNGGRYLILDASRDDPRWIIASAVIPSDTRAAAGPGRLFDDWPDVGAWVGDQVGRQVTLTPVVSMVWRLDERP